MWAGEKQLRNVRLFSLLQLLMVSATVRAQFTFVTNNGAITITGYTGPGGTVTIPSTTNGLPVAGIGDYAFWLNTLNSITIPDSVTNIGRDAFAECYNLTNVTMGNGITSIRQYTFFNCTHLTSIMIPNKVTSIESDAFGSCVSLASVAIGNSVASIGDRAFYYCYGLASVTIPNSVTSIGGDAFNYCISLTNVTIGSGVISIGGFAFYECISLEAITVDGLNSTYTSLDGVLFNKSRTELIQCPGAWVARSLFWRCRF